MYVSLGPTLDAFGRKVAFGSSRPLKFSRTSSKRFAGRCSTSVSMPVSGSVTTDILGVLQKVALNSLPASIPVWKMTVSGWSFASRHSA